MGGEDTSPTVVNVSGPIYGYDQPWSKTETQKLNILVDNGERQYHIEQNPSLTVSKNIQYGVNEPNAISFQGNYKELTKMKAWLATILGREIPPYIMKRKLDL